MRSLLDEVLERVNVLEVVSQYVSLRKAGRNYVGLCPFHKEKTASFTVSPEKQIFYCFGCHEGGNAVHFLAKYERLGFAEALESLATQLGLDTKNRSTARRTPFFDALGKLAAHYYTTLENNRFALKYLADRKIDANTIEEFKLGYSERAGLTKDLARLGIPADALFGAGILKMRENQAQDIFRGRIVIPIVDVNGKVIGFGGRAISNELMPKYLNSPESSIFSKRTVLFGIDKAKREIIDKDEAIVVEGYFDLIALHAIGIRNVVATLGTSITEDQISRLRNFTENITLMLDGDEAGVKSALRVIGLFGEMGINGRMVLLPEAHDPDSLAREQGREGFERLFADKRPLLDYSFEFHMKKCGVGSLEGKLAFIRTVMPYLESMRDEVKKRLYVRRLAEITGVEEYRFWDGLKDETIRIVARDDGPGTGVEKKLVGILVNRPELMEHFSGREVEKFVQDEKLRGVIVRLLDYYERNDRIDAKHFVTLFEDDTVRDAVISATMEVAEYEEAEMERIVVDFIQHRERKFVQEEARRITVELADAEKRGDHDTLLQLLERKKRILASWNIKSVK